MENKKKILEKLSIFRFIMMETIDFTLVLHPISNSILNSFVLSNKTKKYFRKQKPIPIFYFDSFLKIKCTIIQLIHAVKKNILIFSSKLQHQKINYYQFLLHFNDG
jgi:hypothetical protein